MKIHTLDEIRGNPSLVKTYSLVQLQQLADELADLKKGHGRKDIPPDPCSFAEKYEIPTDVNTPWESPPHVKLLSQWIADVEQGKRKNVLITMPPRHGKSLMVSYLLPLWFLSRDPRRRIILASYEHDFAAQWGALVRDYINEHGEKLGLQLDSSQLARDSWKLTAGGGMQSAGAGGPLTGKGADLLIIDDPIKNYEEASSEVQRENLWNWFLSTAYTRLQPGKSGCIILHTRWHQDDLIGRLLTRTRASEEDVKAGKTATFPHWDILNLPAYAEEDDPLGRKPGEPLWDTPERNELLATQKRIQSSYLFSALYQQRPTPEEGGAVKRSWWRFYSTPPADFDQMLQVWDLAFHDLKKSDFCVGQVWGRKGAQFYLIDQVRERMSIVDVIAAVRSFTARYPRAATKLVEDRANGPALIQSLQKEVYGMIPVKPKGSKDARLQAVIPAIESGNVFLPESIDSEGNHVKKRWVWDFIEECAQFPNGTNDDQVDAMVHGLQFMMPASWQAMYAGWKEAIEGPPPKTVEEAQSREFGKYVKKVIKKADKRLNSQTRTFTVRHPKR